MGAEVEAIAYPNISLSTLFLKFLRFGCLAFGANRNAAAEPC